MYGGLDVSGPSLHRVYRLSDTDKSICLEALQSLSQWKSCLHVHEWYITEDVNSQCSTKVK